jgi:hypothetical protein
VRDFNPAYDRFGSKAAEMIGTMRRLMSASPRKRTNSRSSRYVRFGAMCGLMQCSKDFGRLTQLIDQFVGAQQERLRDGQAERLGGG